MFLEENPYIIGRPIYEQECFFGREDLFQFIQNNLRQRAKVIVLYGQRRIGKSSVLAQIPNFVKLEQFAFIPLSLEGKSQKSLNVVLRELALEIKDYLTNELGITADKLSLPSRQESQDNRKIFSDHFLPNVYEVLEGQNLVLLIDEFDVLGDYSEESAANHFFPYLQSILYQQEKLFVIPVVGRRLEDMPNLLGLFRQAPKQEIGRLKANYATRLITEPARTNLDYAPDAIQAILGLSAGHPYFTQVICSALFSYVLDQERRQVTYEDVEGIVNEAIELGEGGLAWFRDGLPPSERVIFSASSEIQEENTKSQFTLEEPLSCLEKHGVIRTDQINKATRNLVDWDFWQKASASKSSTAGIVTYEVTIELVRRWLIKRHPLKYEIWELENANPEAVQFYKLADTSYDQGDVEKATKLYEQVLELNPNYFSALLKLSEVYLNTKAFDRAAAVYSRAYKVDSARTKSGFLQASLGYSQILIQTSEQAENLGKVLELYVQVYQVDPILAKEDFSQTLLNYRQNLAIAKVSTALPHRSPKSDGLEVLGRLQKKTNSLTELLQRCTVKISSLNSTGWGTGCFVAPNLILTCDFVVARDNQNLSLHWGDYESFAEAKLDKLLPDFGLALLRCDLPLDPPCIYLDEDVEPGDNVYSFGYPDNFSSGAPVTLQCEGFTGDYPPAMLLKSGQIRPGMSGAPLLNQRTGKICGIVNFTRGRNVDLGGGGIPTSVIFSAFPELKALQQKFHQVDNRWTQLMLSTQKGIVLEKAIVPKRPRNLQLLISLVRQEIHSRLEQSLNSSVLIQLTKATQPEQVKRPWESEIRIRSKSSELISESIGILQVFDSPEIQGSLLILGQPGSGKTTTLLDLAQALIQRAEDDLSFPFPVLFTLSSWTDPRRGMQDWLVEELKLKYGVRADIAKSLLESKQLAVLLDGLDDVKPGYHSMCVQAINQLLQSEYRPFYLVVCDRIEDYEAYPDKLQLNGAIYLEALTNDQIQDYLVRVQQEEIWKLFSSNPTILELVRTPLLLGIATLVSSELSLQERKQFQASPDPLHHLMASYVEWMLMREIDSHAYSKQRVPNSRQLRHWLVYLSRQLQKESQAEFLIEKMQPSWLSNNKQMQIYQLISNLIVGLISGLSVGLLGLLYGLDFAIIGGLISGLTGGLLDRLNNHIEPVETLKFSWTDLGKGSILVAAGGLVGLLIGGLVGILIGAVVGGAFSSLRRGVDLQTKTFPNEGIRRSAVNALVVSLLSSLLLTTLGILVGLMFGGRACIKHFALRLVLYYYGRIPWNYAQFLDYATERLLLQRTGGRYRFLNRFLQSYFASMPLERYENQN